MRVARKWLADGHQVAALTRSHERAGHFAEIGLTPIIGDITEPKSLRDVPAATTILFAVGFDRQAGPSIEEVYVNGLATFLDAIPSPPDRLIYISSTGVYGQSDGGWVDEDSPCQPNRAGGKACLEAERLLQQSAFADQSVILRCAGLYGPDRVPRLGDLEGGQPIRANPDVWLNLIQIDDLVSIVGQMTTSLPPSNLYVVSDGQPVMRRDFYEFLATLKNLPPPKFEPAADSSRRAGGDNKRIRTDRLQRELQPKLAYPSYREGLAAIET